MSYWINTLLSYLISRTDSKGMEHPKLSLESSKPTKAAQLSWPPPSSFEPICHPRVNEVTEEVDGYFLKHWNFPNEKARKKFVAAGFSRVTCLYFPEARDDRIHFACRLLTVLFLIDDLLDDMSLEDGSAYNEKLIPISRGHVLPDRSIPVEYIIFDLWESMRAHDKEMADEVLEPTFVFMRAQTDKTRTKPMGLGPYFEYREKDVGKALLSALMRFSMGLKMDKSELAIARPVEKNCSKHISVLNDIYSYDKEVIAAQTGHVEGGALCSSVQIMANEADIDATAAKHALWVLCREWERCHEKLVAEIEKEQRNQTSPALRAYMKGLEYQMSGNERWSQSTLRYIGVTAET